MDKNEPAVGGFKDAICCLNAEDTLLENWTLFDSWSEQSGLPPTALNIVLSQVETFLRADEELKEEHYLPFVAWCVSRLHQLWTSGFLYDSDPGMTVDEAAARSNV